MNLGALNLSKTVCWDKYAKFIHEENRKETWEETCDRAEQGLVDRYKHIGEDFVREIRENFSYVRERKVFGSMRYLQFAGPAVEVNNARVFNCSFSPIDSIHAFSENMFLLLSGCGVGYSVEKHNIDKLPDLSMPTTEEAYVIGDTIEGWSDSVYALVGSFLGVCPKPIFDYSKIRSKNSLLVTTGGLAPGPEPLKKALENIEALLISCVKSGLKRLRDIDCHDIMCFEAEAVKAGGIRRAAMIALFDLDSKEMLECKSEGNFKSWGDDKINAQRARSNNSAVIYLYEDGVEEKFKELMRICRDSNVGEPGIVFSNCPDKAMGFNPCVEASLNPYSFCNLSTIVATWINSQEDFNKLARVAAFLGTLQAGFTDIDSYLRPIWKENTEKDALIGVSMTGVAHGNINGLDKREAANEVLKENERVAQIIGINPAARCCLMKPEGTATLAAGLGDGPGLHAGKAKFLKRRVGLEKKSELARYFRDYHSYMYEDSVYDDNEAFAVFPIKNSDSVLLQSQESAVEFISRVVDYSKEWIQPSHRRGANTHNVSATVSVREDEWEEVIDFVWQNRDAVSGLSFFPAGNGASFPQLIYEEIDEEEYLRLEKVTEEIYPETIWLDHGTDYAQEPACAGNKCEM